jgi:hypothetical protein
MASRSQLEQHIGDLAALFGWRRHHTRAPGLTRDGRPDGFPSETLVHGERLLFLFTTKRLTPLEREWLHALRGVTSIETHVCHAGELPMVTQLLRPVEERRGA